MRLNSLTRVEWVLVAFVVPFLMFPTVLPKATTFSLGVLMLWWGFLFLSERVVWPVTPFNGAFLLLVVSIWVSTLTTPIPALTLPKVTNLILGFAVFRALVWRVQDRKSLRWALYILVLVGLGMIIVGAMNVSWSAKLPVLRPWLQRLPKAPWHLPELSDQRGVNPNQLGGILAFYLPFIVGVIWSGRGSWPWKTRVFLGGIGLFAGIVLLLTQSRSGWIGGSVGIIAIAIERWWVLRDDRWRRRIAVLVFAILLVCVFNYGSQWGDMSSTFIREVSDKGVASTPWGRVNVRDRVEIWAHSIYALNDFPLTGLGLGTFRQLIQVLYPFIYVPSRAVLYHAHNVFLHAGTDLGFPGMIAYIALVLTGVLALFKSANMSGEVQAVVRGIGAGFLGYHVYGITDTLSLGSKPGLLFWIALGLLAAISRMAYRSIYLPEANYGEAH